MKILIINKFWYPRGGAERYALDLAHELEARGHEVIPFAMSHPDNFTTKYDRYFVSYLDFSHKPSPISHKLRLFLRLLWSFEAARKLEALIRKTKPDVAHLHNIAHQLSPSILWVLRRHKIPVVMTLHDYKLVNPNYSRYHNGAICDHVKSQRWLQAVIHRCVRNSYLVSLAEAIEMWLHHSILHLYEKWVTRFLSPSEHLISVFDSYQFPRKIHYLAPSVVTSQTKEIKSAGFVYIGRLSEEKGIDVLIEAMHQLAIFNFQFSIFKLRIVGDGPERGHLEQKVRALGLKDHVEFTGPKYGDELAEIRAGAKALIVPSVWEENAPLAVLEAMAAGKCVIASRIGGIPELIREGATGLLVTPRDPKALAAALQRVENDPDLVKKIGHQAQAYVQKHFSPEIHFSRLEKIYHEVSS